MTAALAAALRASAAGLYPGEAGTELLISHGGILHRPGFAGFVHTGTGISGGTTLMAWTGWDAAITALHHGKLPLSGGDSASCGSPPASPAESPPASARTSPAWITGT